MTRLNRRLRIILPALVAICAFAISVLCGNFANAISNVGPDPADFDNYDHIRYSVANSPWNTTAVSARQQTLTIPIYFVGTGVPHTTGVTLKIDRMFRDATSGSAKQQYVTVQINGHSPTARFYCPMDGSVHSGCTDTCAYKCRYITLNNGRQDFEYDSNTQTWRAVVTIQLVNGNSNPPPLFFDHNSVYFRLNVPDTGNWLIGNSYYPDGVFSTVAEDQSYPALEKDTYDIHFATPCNVPDGTVSDIYLYDLDNLDPDNDSFPVSVRIYDQTGVHRQLRDTGRLYPYPTDPVDPRVGDYITSGSMANGGSFRIQMRFKWGHIYALKVEGISRKNLISYTFPYDNINYNIRCQADYELNPHVTLVPSRYLDAGEDLAAKLSVDNVGTTPSPRTEWKLERKVGAAAPVIVDQDGGSTIAFTPGSPSPTALPRPTYTDPDTNHPAGTQICYTLSVKPHMDSIADGVDSGWVSDTKCATIGKKPKVQVQGGDLIVGRQFGGTSVPGRSVVTSKSVKGGGTFGSWVEYAIFAAPTSGLGYIRGIASGSAFASPSGLTVNATKGICQYSTLSFTNAKNTDITCNHSSASAGAYSFIPSGIPDVLGSFPGGVSIPASTASTFVADDQLIGPDTGPRTYIGSTTGNITLNASTLTADKTVVIKADNPAGNATVTIVGYQKYSPGPYTSITQLPQLIIIANKIVIDGSVTEVNAWLIAKSTHGHSGTVETCNINSSDYPLTDTDRLTINKCNQPLTVNGPVMAKQLFLRRTAPTGGAIGDPAEVFNLRADAYLWAYAYASRTSHVQTVETTELPPRF